MSNDFKEEIIDHALLNAENFSMAINIAKAFDDIRKRVITKFAQSLLTSLQTNLPCEDGWIINTDDLINSPFNKYSGLCVENTNWPEGLGLCIEAQGGNSRSFAFIVYGNESIKLSEEKKSEIKAELEKRGVTPKSKGPNTIWYRMVHPDLENWDNEVALLKIHNGGALEYFTEELVSIAKILNSICNKSGLTLSSMP